MILVTGATGLLGSHLLVQLTQAGHRCRALYRNQEKIKRVKALFTYYFQDDLEEKWASVDWQFGDLLNFTDVDEALSNIEYVYHCAALISFFKADFESCIKNNRVATANVVNFSLKHQIKKMCYVSSTAAVGVQINGLTSEKNKWIPGNDVSGYSVSKFLAETEVWRGIEEGLDAVIINPCVIFGPGDWNSTSLAIFKAAQKGLPFYPPGANAIVDARDVAFAMTRLMESDTLKKRFLCVGQNLTFKHLFTSLSTALGKKVPKFTAPKAIALFFALLNELLGHITENRGGISIESVHAGYKTITYDCSLLDKTIDIKFHTLAETIENVIHGSRFVLEIQKT